MITASDAIQYAFEDETLPEAERTSVFTRAVLDGLTDGAADLDGDGWISVDELFSYVRDRVGATSHQQRPLKFAIGQDGDICVARAGAGAPAIPSHVPRTDDAGPATHTPISRRQPSRRHLLLGAAAAAVLVIAGLIAMALSGGGEGDDADLIVGPASVTYDKGATYTAGLDAASYAWRFPDGTTASSPTVFIRVQPDTPSPYRIQLTAFTGDDTVKASRDIVLVQPAPGDPATAEIVGPTQVTADANVVYFSSTENAVTGTWTLNGVEQAWSPVTQRDFEFRPTEPGTYQLSLRVEGPEGQEAFNELTITVT